MTAIAWGALSHDMIDDLFAAELEELHLADRYEVHRILGQGGQGTVYLAKDTHIGREVAIKCAYEQSVSAECNLMSSLAHPGIPQIYDRGVAIDGTHYLVMQYIAGQRLDHYLQEVQPSLAQRIALFHDIAGAVAHAHQQGILHRDLKPSNIMVSDKAKATIIDWGLAAKGDPRSICGSPHFAAPEQLDGQPSDQRADIFALGVLLYFIISGELPYARRVTDFNEFRAVRAGLRRIPLKQVSPHAPAYLDLIAQRATAPQAGARYQSVARLLAALDAEQHILTKSQQGWLRRSWLPLFIACLLGAAFVLGGIYGPQLASRSSELFFGTKESDGQASDQLFIGPPTAEEMKLELNLHDTSQPQADQAGQSEQGTPENSQKTDEADLNINKQGINEHSAAKPNHKHLELPSLNDVLGDPTN